jgi:hypothetical protein
MSDPQSRQGCAMSLKLMSSGLGIVLGIMVFFIFTFHYQNIEAGIWALVSAAFSAMVFHLYLLYRNFRLETWHTPHSLLSLRNLAILGFLASISATVYYFYTAASQHEPVYPISDSHLIRGVWAFMTLKWSVALAYYAQKYKRLLDREYSLM